eukprot:CAMPEP_0178515832 /NCGR_PEP_ID=MMETSP0696-20121128/24769_1 /TAXON_ID=265572 /ORGANISM="Extubocellulus spinifer, Strain CCMP396" /LENGTH=155 /DNA_ID=CAMNT_0020146025 /DNA_START=76 /DNA_END=539 /DNA_ORIENTATION=-
MTPRPSKEVAMARNGTRERWAVAVPATDSIGITARKGPILNIASPSDVRYNNCTVKICTKEGCGPDLHDATKKEYGNQQEAKKRARTAKKASREKEKASMRARIEELKKEGRKREARRLRAAMLGMDPDDPELNSDVDPDGCEEFDYASDSSLVP